MAKITTSQSVLETLSKLALAEVQASQADVEVVSAITSPDVEVAQAIIEIWFECERMPVTVQEIISPYPILPLPENIADFTWTIAGHCYTSGAKFPLTGREILLIKGGALGGKITVITSVADSYKRVGNIENYAIGAGEYAAFMFPVEFWRQTDRQLYFRVSDTTIEIAVLRLPNITNISG